MGPVESLFTVLGSFVGLVLLYFIIGGLSFFISTFKRVDSDVYGTLPDDKMSEQKKMRYEMRRQEIDHLDTLSCQEMEIESFDGTKLVGRLYRAEKSKALVICVHGYRSNGRRCFGGFVPALNDQGLDVLLVDDRAHGDSEGKWTGFTVLDRIDVKCWIENMKGSYDKIYLFGNSMGAATCGLVAADIPEIAGLVFDCGFTSPMEAFRTRVKDKMPSFLSEPVFFFGRLWCRMILGFDFKKVSTLEEMKKVQCPVLFIQGGNDKIVPKEMAEKLFEACPSESKRLEIFEEAEHSASFYVERERYLSLLHEFFN
ncbi:MAG: alpha/beta fold hydrolase [Clostridia bacterium]|nr:alpha/beta fold hydrolase [Clostridia bacterium]